METKTKTETKTAPATCTHRKNGNVLTCKHCKAERAAAAAKVVR